MELWRAINGPASPRPARKQAIKPFRVVPRFFLFGVLISWGKMLSECLLFSPPPPPRIRRACKKCGLLWLFLWAPTLARRSRFRQRQPSGLVTTLPGRPLMFEDLYVSCVCVVGGGGGASRRIFYSVLVGHLNRPCFLVLTIDEDILPLFTKTWMIEACLGRWETRGR